MQTFTTRFRGVRARFLPADQLALMELEEWASLPAGFTLKHALRLFYQLWLLRECGAHVELRSDVLRQAESVFVGEPVAYEPGESYPTRQFTLEQDLADVMDYLQRANASASETSIIRAALGRYHQIVQRCRIGGWQLGIRVGDQFFPLAIPGLVYSD